MAKKPTITINAKDAKFIARALRLYGHNYCPFQAGPTANVATLATWNREARKAKALAGDLDTLALDAEQYPDRSTKETT